MEQVYCVIKDNVCHLMYNYEFSNLVPETLHLYDRAKEIELMEKNGYIIDTLAHAYEGELSQRIIRVGTTTFGNIKEAAQWCIDEGYSAASLPRIESTLRRNLEGKTKTAYGKKFEYGKKLISLDSLEIVL